MNTVPPGQTEDAAVGGQLARQPMRRKHNYHWHAELLHSPTPMVGPADDASIDEVLMLLASLPVWPGPDPFYGHARAHAIVRGARQVLQWLLEHPGEGWQDRWLAAGADTGMGWVDPLIAHDPRTHDKCRDELVAACRICCWPGS